MQQTIIKEIDVSQAELDQVYSDGFWNSNEIIQKHCINGYALLKSWDQPKATAIVRYLGKDNWTLIKTKDLKFEGILPKDLKQTIFMDSLNDSNILASVGIGDAGTGKTTIAMAYALKQYIYSKKKIVLTKPASMVGEGRAFGPVPGDINEKYAPYLASYQIILNKIANSPQYITMMQERKDLQFFPIELVRGCTFENVTLILDEAQNLNWHELYTLITRLGDGSKLIILGDLNQIDTGTPQTQTGLYKMLHTDKFNESPLTSATELVVQYRSPIVDLAIQINKQIVGSRP